jgi:hypothetical protein
MALQTLALQTLAARRDWLGFYRAGQSARRFLLDRP